MYTISLFYDLLFTSTVHHICSCNGKRAIYYERDRAHKVQAQLFISVGWWAVQVCLIQ